MSSPSLPMGLAGGLALIAFAAAAESPAPLAPPVAQRICARCHSLGPADASHFGAPPFRQVALRYNELSLEKRLAGMNGRPHIDMPKVSLQPDEIRDLAAYIANLR